MRLKDVMSGMALTGMREPKIAARRSLRATIVTLLCVAALVFTVAAPAQATSSTVWGTLNCTGSTVYYNTIRYTSGSNTIGYWLSDSAGSQYGVDATYLGVYIVAENSYKGLKYMSMTGPVATLSSTYWLANTSFKLYGKMPVCNGTCDNYFSGSLGY